MLKFNMNEYKIDNIVIEKLLSIPKLKKDIEIIKERFKHLYQELYSGKTISDESFFHYALINDS